MDINPKVVVIMIIYVALIYTTVGVFTSTTESFVFAGGTDVIYSNSTVGENATDPSNMTIWESIVDYISGSVVGQFFGMVYDAFGYLFDFLTFGSYRTVISEAALIDGSTIPTWLVWIPALLVLPVWIFVIYWLAPYAIKFLEAIGALINAVIPF